ncbi:MAG: glycosyltransferase family 4 protein [Nitrososphaerota archaeon]|nr:glycosyltransferase family 4 protein [Nitrososphaerota archaeon]
MSPADPLTRRPRAGPLLRLLHPPPGVDYEHRTDRVSVPAGTGSYCFSPVNLGLAALKFGLEHAFPVDDSRASLVHSFFWDIRKFSVPWVHESDQSFGQFLSGYNNVRGFVKSAVTGGYSSYLNSRGCAGVITWTRWAKRGFEDDGVDSDKVAVVPPPVVPHSRSLPHSGCNILFLGRDYQRKGGDVVLKAFSSMDAPDCRLHYVGEADPRAAKAFETDGRVAFYEHPSNSTLADEIWPLIDVLALPTRADAFAMTVTEAMSRGIPVVTSALPPIAEVVEDGESGYLAPVGDVVGFAERLGRLAADPALRSKVGARGQERVKTLFSPSVVGRRLMEVYRRAS